MPFFFILGMLLHNALEALEDLEDGLWNSASPGLRDSTVS